MFDPFQPVSLTAALVILGAGQALALALVFAAGRRSQSLKTSATAAPAAPAGAVTYRIDPGPNDVAIAFGAAYLASGRADNIQAAMVAAWAAVPQFYEGRQLYLQEIAPLYFAPRPPPAEELADAAA